MLGRHPLVRFLNQNIKQILITILAITLFILALRFLNSLSEKKIQNNVAKANEYYSNVAIENEHKKVIESFLEFCKKGDESNAYALLSSKSKIQDFSTEENFSKNYISKFFNSSKTYNISNMINSDEEYNYYVVIKDDMLSTGNINSTSITQYFTVVEENGVDKIIIQNFNI